MDINARTLHRRNVTTTSRHQQLLLCIMLIYVFHPLIILHYFIIKPVTRWSIKIYFGIHSLYLAFKRNRHVRVARGVSDFAHVSGVKCSAPQGILHPTPKRAMNFFPRRRGLSFYKIIYRTESTRTLNVFAKVVSRPSVWTHNVTACIQGGDVRVVTKIHNFPDLACINISRTYNINYFASN